MRCARAASRGPQIDSDDDNNPEIIFAESDQSYIKKLAAELLRCHDDLEGKISFVFDERHGTLRNAHGQPKPFDGEGLEKRAWLRRARCTGRVRAGASTPARKRRKCARGTCPGGEAWAIGRSRQGAACAAALVHIRAASALGCDAPERRVCVRAFQLKGLKAWPAHQSLD